ncbi:RPA-interacting protein B-like isoform X2 [Homarus americanus]|uniref:RPA-interacting protein B-like isoform X2 n=1 Tax=Homarus americanus TaxID=6706 RepID=UPI001C4851A5|nr:RPA-interacting protein B-like isoform X2 [Homarus americanus]
MSSAITHTCTTLFIPQPPSPHTLKMEAGQKSSLDKRLLHRMLYKNARGRTPPWKDAYRKRCMDRLRSNRSQLIEHFRSAGDAINNNNSSGNHTTKMVQDVMEIEWAAMSQAASGFPSLNKASFSVDDPEEEDQNLLFAIMEDIQQELVSEEEKLLIDVLNYDAAVLASQVALQQSEEVICPVCQGLQESPRRPSILASSTAPLGAGPGANILVCGCGLALQGANLTLNTVKSSLENTVSHHGQTCQGQMSFTPTTDTQGANVLITCNICDWMSFLL